MLRDKVLLAQGRPGILVQSSPPGRPCQPSLLPPVYGMQLLFSPYPSFAQNFPSCWQALLH